jgi:hypothetical protein
LGDPEAVAERVYGEMFPAAKAGSIGGEQPLDWSSTQDTFKKTIQAERVKALSGDISHDVVYTYAHDEKPWNFRDGDTKSDTLVDVVVGLDEGGGRLEAAAVRAREFFADGVA